MNTTSSSLPTLTDTRRSVPVQPAPTFKTPHFDTQSTDGAMRIVVYVPGVTASGIEIRSQDTDLTVIARKESVLRQNWRSLHLERAQSDYLLSLRLGRNLDQTKLRAELKDGLLTIEVPTFSSDPARHRSPALNQSRL